MTRPSTDLRARVVQAAERVLAAKGVVSPIDLLQQMQFLAPSLVRGWEKGVFEHLYPRIQCGPKKLAQTSDLVVFITVSDSFPCEECGDTLERGDFVFREKNRTLCLHCADLDHLEFLPRGDAAMSRRGRKHSPLCAVVVQFHRRRKRYERQGILITAEAIARAEEECLSDADRRAAQRARGAVQRERQDGLDRGRLWRVTPCRGPHNFGTLSAPLRGENKAAILAALQTAIEGILECGDGARHPPLRTQPWVSHRFASRAERATVVARDQHALKFTNHVLLHILVHANLSLRCTGLEDGDVGLTAARTATTRLRKWLTPFV